MRNGVDGGNGVYRYGSGGGFPNSTFDVNQLLGRLVFSPSGADTTKPTVTDRQPALRRHRSPGHGTTVSATFSEPVQQPTITMTLTSGRHQVAGITSYDAATRTVTLTPTQQPRGSTTYTVNLSGARDTAGNTMDPVTLDLHHGSQR